MTKKYYRVQLREMKSENDRERLSERGREIEKERVTLNTGRKIDKF